MELHNLLGFKEFVEKDVRKFNVTETPRTLSSKDVLATEQKPSMKDETEEYDEKDLTKAFKAKKTAGSETGKDVLAEGKKEPCEGCDKDEKHPEGCDCEDCSSEKCDGCKDETKEHKKGCKNCKE